MDSLEIRQQQHILKAQMPSSGTGLAASKKKKKSDFAERMYVKTLRREGLINISRTCYKHINLWPQVHEVTAKNHHYNLRFLQLLLLFLVKGLIHSVYTVAVKNNTHSRKMLTSITRVSH